MHRIETIIKKDFKDSIAESVSKAIKNIGINVQNVRTVRAYTINSNLTSEQLHTLGRELFADPIVEEFFIDNPAAILNNCDWIIEVSFKPGVTDNVGNTALAITKDIVGNDVSKISSSMQYLITGDLREEDNRKIAREILGNELIENFVIKKISGTNKNELLQALLSQQEEWKGFVPKVKTINLRISDQELVKLSKDMCLALNLEEMKKIKSYFSNPEVLADRKKFGLTEITDVEIEMLAQTWSEHCKHKIFNAHIKYSEFGKTEEIDSLFNTFIKGATSAINKKWLVSVFHDNAGVIKLDDEYNLVFKVETHNSPSALDPYGGALTGIVGCNRDPMGTGKCADLIANTNVFCFADPYYSGDLPERIMHPKRIFEGVRRGVEHGGNKMGVPTVNGSIVFDNRYMGKPLVYCGTLGIMPNTIKGMLTHEKQSDSQDLIVIVGGRTGKDGIHGATFSSEELHENSPITAVQIGDPITQKKMMDFLLEARDLGLIKNITDNGAGGLSCSVGEMAISCGGAKLELEKVPLKYKGIMPWEIIVSESQERMTVAVSPEKIQKFLSKAKEKDVEATVIGMFNDSGKFHVTYHGRTVALLDLDFLHNGVPKMKLEAVWNPFELEEPAIEVTDYNEELKKLLSSLNICSKEYVIRQYDHEVQGSSVIKPLTGAENDGPSDSSVIRPLELSRKFSWKGIAISNAIIPRYSDIDTYHMAACCIDEAIRNLVCVGADPDYIALLDNFCWPDPLYHETKNPDGKHKLAQLVRANKALYDYATKFQTPFISGKDSMKNDYKNKGTKISVPPTLLISAVGIVEDIMNCVTMDAKEKGDYVYVVGITKDELGASEFYASHNHLGKNVPKVDADSAIKNFRAVHNAIKKGLLRSCHDCSDGGLAVALAETAFSGNLGMKINIEKVPSETDDPKKILFSESQSRFVITVNPELADEFENEMQGVIVARIGVVQEERFVVDYNGKNLINESWKNLKEAWQKTLRW